MAGTLAVVEFLEEHVKEDNNMIKDFFPFFVPTCAFQSEEKRSVSRATRRQSFLAMILRSFRVTFVFRLRHFNNLL